MQPLLGDFAGILPDEPLNERLEPCGTTGGNLALNLIDLVRVELVSLDLVGGGTGSSGGLECHLAATKVTQIGIIAKISALIAGIDFRHSSVSSLLLDVTVYYHPPQGLHHNAL